MSWYPLTWAETAPVADVYERAILTLLAHRAAGDGTGAYPPVSKMAEYAVCDVATVKRRLGAMRRRGLIDYGNQRVTQHLPRDRRPKVYDLLIPLSWYSAAQLEEVNRERAQRGTGPLSAEARPDLTTPERSRKARSDKGQPKPRKKPGSSSSEGVSGDTGVLVAPPVGDPAEQGAGRGSGGATSTPAGVLVVQDGGATSTPIHNLPTGDTSPDTSGGKAGPRTPASRKVSSPPKSAGDQLGLTTQPQDARVEIEPGSAQPEFDLWGVGALEQERAHLEQTCREVFGRELFLAQRRLLEIKKTLGTDTGGTAGTAGPDLQELTLVGPVARQDRRRHRR